jgi:hypothetical protein
LPFIRALWILWIEFLMMKDGHIIKLRTPPLKVENNQF